MFCVGDCKEDSVSLQLGTTTGCKVFCETTGDDFDGGESRLIGVFGDVDTWVCETTGGDFGGRESRLIGVLWDVNTWVCETTGADFGGGESRLIGVLGNVNTWFRETIGGDGSGGESRSIGVVGEAKTWVDGEGFCAAAWVENGRDGVGLLLRENETSDEVGASLSSDV